jgi:hypothetical protein
MKFKATPLTSSTLTTVTDLSSKQCHQNTKFYFSAYNDRTKCYKNHKFDIVFDTEASQGQIFAECGVPNLIKQVVNGYNSTIFAYG